VGIVDATVDDPDDDTPVAGRMVPGGGCADRVEAPEPRIAVTRVIRDPGGVVAIVRFDVAYPRRGRVGARLLPERSPGVTRHHPRANTGEPGEGDTTARSHDSITRRYPARN
jgi:hypothetical protein